VTTQPSHRQQTPAPSADHAETQAAAQAFLADIESILAQRPTSFRDNTPTPTIGSAPPVPQPGIPPQSRAAVDYAVRVLSTAVATALTSGSLALLLYASKFANPLVCAIVFGAPIGLAVPIAALASLVKRTKEVVAATPPTINQHYSGPITQTNQTINADSHGLIAITRPELPPAR
jgi:hypothetical protein